MLPKITGRKPLWGIRNKLIAAFTAITIIPLVVLSCIVSQNIMRQNEQAIMLTTAQEVRQVDIGLDIFLEGVKENVRELVNQPLLKNVDNSVTSYIDKKGEANGLVKMRLLDDGSREAELYKHLVRFKAFHPKIEFLSMGIESNGGYVQCPATTRKPGYDPRVRRWYKLAVDNPGEVMITAPYLTSNAEAVEVSFVKTVIDDAGTLKGVVSVDMTLQGLSGLIKNIKLGANGYIMITDQAGTIIADASHPDRVFKNIKEFCSGKVANLTELQEEVLEVTLDGRPTVFNIYTSPKTGWKIIGVIDKQDILSGAVKMQKSILCFSFVIMLMAIALGTIMAQRIANPIQKVATAAREIAAGDLSAPRKLNLRSDATDEIGVLENSIIVMAGEIQRNFRELEESYQRREQALYDAHHDALTGLPNRRLLEDRLLTAIEQAKTGYEIIAVVFLDLDDFKVINDTWGHEEGDYLLKEFAQRVKGHLREGDIVARFGGDEFVLLLTGLKSQNEAIDIVSRLREICQQPFAIEDRNILIAVSIGISFYPEDGDDVASLLRNADSAMYISKRKN